MNIDKIKPIPKYIVEQIRKKDLASYPAQDSRTRYYSYLIKQKQEVIKITVAVRNYRKNWLYKQVAAHSVHGDRCYVKDMIYYHIAGYIVDWSQEIPQCREYYRDHSWGWAYPKDFDPWSKLINKEFLSKMDKYKYSGYQYLESDRIISFLIQYEKYPVVEFLMKFGFTNFWSSEQICIKATKDKNFRKWLIKQKDVAGINYFYVMSLLTAYKKNKDVTIQEKLERAKRKLRVPEYADLRQHFKGEQEKLLDYVATQKISIDLYNDYFKVCNYIGLDMTLPKNRYPHEFMRWHDIRIDQYNSKRAEEEKVLKEDQYKKFALIAEKYLPLEKTKNTSYVVIIAHSPYELKLEGEALHHCVGRCNYDQKFIREESLIFFVRDINDIKTPLVTMEYGIKSRNVLQLYANNNQKPSDEIQKYIYDKWLPYANNKLKQITI